KSHTPLTMAGRPRQRTHHTPVTHAVSSLEKRRQRMVSRPPHPESSPATERILPRLRSVPPHPSLTPRTTRSSPETAIHEVHPDAPARADQCVCARVCECAGDGIGRSDLSAAALSDAAACAPLHYHPPRR